MQLELENKGIEKIEEQFMPYVHHNEIPMYCILRLGTKHATLKDIKTFESYVKREFDSNNGADAEKTKQNIQLYGAENLYIDSKNYLSDARIYKRNIVGREMLLTATPEFFKGLSKEEFESWKNVNIEWLKGTFKDNLRAAYLHLDQKTPHIHALLICKQWSDRAKGYTLRNNAYFDGVRLLRAMQDNYAEFIQKSFPVLHRGIVGSKSKNISMKQIHAMKNQAEKEDIKTLQEKAVNQECLKQKVSYMDKTLKALENYKEKETEENKKLRLENEILQDKLQKLQEQLESTKEQTLDKDKKIENKRRYSNRKGFSGTRYNKVQ